MITEEYPDFVESTGYGEDPLGLCGINCYHQFYPFIPGVSTRLYTDEQLDKMNAEENEKKAFNGKAYTKYEATQYQRKLETVMRKQKQDIKLLKEAGLADDSDDVTFAKCRYQKTVAKYKEFSKEMGLREHWDRVNTAGLKDIKSREFLKANDKEQNYKPVAVDEKQSLQSQRGEISIVANKITTANNDIYVSNAVTLKPKQLHFIDNCISDTVKTMGITDFSNLPSVVIINNHEMQTGAIASYNPVRNVLFLDENIGIKKNLLELQKDAACSDNPLSTYVHEFMHWRDAETYRSVYGDITDNKEYIQWIRHRCKKKIDNLIDKGYNINNISTYAKKGYVKKEYDETYTEYCVKQLLGE